MKLNSLKRDVHTFAQIADQSSYSIGRTIFDLTGVGTLYSLGSDYAHKKRLENMEITTAKMPAFQRLIQEYVGSTNYSLASKVVYLASLGALGAGYLWENPRLLTIGGVGASAFAVFSIMRAGFHSTQQHSIKDLVSQLKLSMQEQKP